MPELNLVQQIAIWILPIVFAVTLHEAAHGLVAYWLGDKTAWMLGRLSLNPMKHIDWVGTVIVPITVFALSGMLIGWAKPIPITPRNLKHPRRDSALIAAAGPGANLLMAVIWALLGLLSLSLLSSLPWLGMPLKYMASSGVVMNVFLMVLNLLPLPPLDGAKIISALLPHRMSYHYEKLEPYGFYILLGLLALGWLNNVLYPMVKFIILLIFSVTGFIS